MLNAVSQKHNYRERESLISENNEEEEAHGLAGQVWIIERAHTPSPPFLKMSLSRHQSGAL